MSNNTVRIRTTPNGTDKYLKVKLEQDFDFIEVLSLKISQEDAYRNFCSDYGVVTGRVIVNSGFGVPNAKVSIFIPIDEFDKSDPNILGLYPYEIVSDKDDNGVRYNLLPKSSETNNECFTPIGTFPNKRDIIDNPEMLDIFCKYYKFTTTTNYAGDFMIFGVPIGTYTIHVDADISDIGIASQRPYDSISQGTPTKFFETPTKFKGGTNLDSLIQVKSVNAGVNVQPFWGDTETCEIGITRIDLDLNYTIRPCAIFIGSIFGDNEKNSINKNCNPRKNIGTLCEQTTNEGSVEMIRETLEGDIERFDVEGGRVIDENGAWAYQVPMNLDYMVTDEFGGLILSDDPNKGVPTRSSVRFRIGMDQTGGEARLRTRAKYLVPNNPNTQNEIDYEFGENTKKTSFRNLYWNKIYSINNYIPRFQANNGINKDMVGIKNVDGCVGVKNPFPFNRINTSTSPIFFIVCLLIKTIGFMIYIMNRLIIPIINLPIINQSKYVPCVYVKCPSDSNTTYAPGCRSGSKGFKSLDNGCVDVNPDDNTAENDGDVPLDTSSICEVPTYYEDDLTGEHSGFGNLCGLDDCFANQMVERMELIDYQFYNDWVNGSLYSFLLKYKKKRNEKESFCEYDCDDFENSEDSTTVDSNGNGIPDNNCNNNFILDTCFNGNGNNQQNSTTGPNSFREGLIKKVGDEFYYAASTHNANLKLFATDIINLGSVFDCDWQGVPKIQQYLINTTYNIPPSQDEIDSNNVTVLTSGQINLLYDINCSGPHVDTRQCLNIRHICEFGVELDEYRGVGNLADNIIGINELDTDSFSTSKLVRDVFSDLNSDYWTLNYPRTTEFNLQNCGEYDFAKTQSISCNLSLPNNGLDYINFRNYSLGGIQVNGDTFGQTQNSFYFYFGLEAGKTGLDLMNQRFFTTCFDVKNTFSGSTI
jgi:hypothetical protein